MSRDPLKLLPFDVAKVRSQDVVVLVAVLAATFLVRAPNVWELKPSWQLYITSDASQTPGRNNLGDHYNDGFQNSNFGASSSERRR